MKPIRGWVMGVVLVIAIGAYIIWGNSNARSNGATSPALANTPDQTANSQAGNDHASYSFARNLTVGSTGADVTALQQFLIDQKYLTDVSSPTGYFGFLTKAAVAKFQAKNNISLASGYFGPKTRAIISGVTTVPTPVPIPPTVPTSTTTGVYKNGMYTGSVADAIYGQLQVAVTISGGKITNVAFPQYPNDPGRTSQLAALALPKLKQEAIASQSANVNVVSGATQDSDAFRESLASALAQAKS